MKISDFARVEPMNTRRASSWKDLAVALSRLREGPKEHWGCTMDSVMA
jgi:hypothetical protein